MEGRLVAERGPSGLAPAQVEAAGVKKHTQGKQALHHLFAYA